MYYNIGLDIRKVIIMDNIETNDRFLAACQSGDIKQIKDCLLDPTQPACIHYHDDHAIIVACENGHLDVVKYLLHSKEIPENLLLPYDNYGAFRAACYYGKLHIVQYLLTDKELVEKGIPFADIHANSDESLLFSLHQGHIEIAEYLLTGADLLEYSNLFARDNCAIKMIVRTPSLWEWAENVMQKMVDKKTEEDKFSFLHFLQDFSDYRTNPYPPFFAFALCETADLTVVKKQILEYRNFCNNYLPHNECTNYIRSVCQKILVYATFLGKEDIINGLIKDVDLSPPKTEILLRAAQGQHTDNFIALYEKLNVDYAEQFKEVANTTYIDTNRLVTEKVESSEFFIANSPNLHDAPRPYITAPGFLSPLRIACIQNNVELVSYLLKDKKIHLLEGELQVGFLIACENSSIEVLYELLNNTLVINSLTNYDYKKGLMSAFANDNPRVVELIFKFNPNANDDFIDSLRVANKNNSIAALKILLAHTDKYDYSIYAQLFIEASHKEDTAMLDLLLTQCPFEKINEHTYNKAFLNACSHENVDMVTKLYDYHKFCPDVLEEGFLRVIKHGEDVVSPIQQFLVFEKGMPLSLALKVAIKDMEQLSKLFSVQQIHNNLSNNLSAKSTTMKKRKV